MTHFEDKLKGGHHNSLGNTVEVVQDVLQDNSLFDELFQCYFSHDELVRLRVSSAMKRICKEKPSLLIPYINRFLDEISLIDQASTKWTLAQLFDLLKANFDAEQLTKAKSVIKNNLATASDWIVLNTSMETLTNWTKDDSELLNWLIPELKRLTDDDRKSVSNRAKKYLKALQ